jgi:hypothetical protein
MIVASRLDQTGYPQRVAQPLIVDNSTLIDGAQLFVSGVGDLHARSTDLEHKPRFGPAYAGSPAPDTDAKVGLNNLQGRQSYEARSAAVDWPACGVRVHSGVSAEFRALDQQSAADETRQRSRICGDRDWS